MFYSQFILAKKGPLGTIWIAAHLERKLKKNQVADTDIGDSVDSILFPDVPIALRLSSHLLLGVVRIYSRKVNYLFHDCSEALLKVKQAFRSSAVDLPPEESTAPYHSITLPETFDLDDFELPDSALLNDNFDDRHVSSREHITLQDTLDGTGYSTSQFGLDERFGDGEASQFGLDLDEELLDTNLKLQHDPVSYDDPHKGEGGSDLTKMDIDESQPGGDEDRNNEASRELSELLCNDHEKHVISDVQNMNRFDDASHRLAFNIQTPDLNEVFLPDNHNGGPSGAHNMDMDFSAADPPPPEFNQFANFPSTTIPANCQELPSSNPQENLPYTDIANDKLDKPVNKEVECPDATNKSLVNATVTNPELDNIAQAVSFPASILDESKSDSVAPQCSGGIFPSLYPVNDVHHIHNDSNDAATSGKLVSIESSDPQQSEVSRVLPSSTLVLPKAVPDSLVPPPVNNPGWVGFESTLRTTNNSHAGIVWNGANNLPGSVDKGTPYDSNDAATSGKLVSIESTDPKRSEVSQVLPSSTLVLPEAVPDSQVPPCSEGTVDNPGWVGFESTLRTTNNSHAGIVWNGANNLPGSVDNGTPYDSNAAATSGKLVSIESTDPKRSEVSRVLPSSTTNNSHAGIVWNGANNLPGSVDNGTPYYSNDAATSGKLVSIESTDPKRLEVSRVLPSSTLVQAVTDSQVPPCSDGTVDNPWRVGFESTLRTTNNSHAGIVWNGANNLPGFVDNGTPYDSNAAATSGKFVSIESTDPKRSEVSRVLPSSSSVLHEAVPDSLVPPCSDGTVDNPGWVGFESTLRTTNNAHAGIVWNGANNLPGSVDKGTPYADHTRQWNLDQCRVEEANFHQTNNFSALSSDFQMRSCTSVSNQANLGSAGDMLLEKTPGFSSRDQPCNLETPMVDLEMHISRSSLGLRGFSSGAIVSNIGSHLQLNDIRLGHPNCFSSSEFSEPERMLFAPSGNVNLSSDLGLQTIEKGVLEPDGSVDRISNLHGNKRRLLDNTPEAQNDISPNMSGAPQKKQNTDYIIPKDDDLLASILVGRTPALKIGPTPPLPKPSSKRPRLTQKVGLPKRRKVLLDETIVLHADAIRQQLINTEDIRRLRRKAPCTRPEIWRIQKSFIEEDSIFCESIFTGMSDELNGLPRRYDPVQNMHAQANLHHSSGEAIKEFEALHHSSGEAIKEFEVSKSSPTVRDNDGREIAVQSALVTERVDGDVQGTSGGELIYAESFQHAVSINAQKQLESPFEVPFDSKIEGNSNNGSADAEHNSLSKEFQISHEIAEVNGTALHTDDLVSFEEFTSVDCIAVNDGTSVQVEDLSNAKAASVTVEDMGVDIVNMNNLDRPQDERAGMTENNRDVASASQLDSFIVDVGAGFPEDSSTVIEHANISDLDLGLVCGDAVVDGEKASSEVPCGEMPNMVSFPVPPSTEGECVPPAVGENSCMNAEGGLDVESSPTRESSVSFDFCSAIDDVDTDFLNVDDDAEYDEETINDAPHTEEAQSLENSGWSSRTRGVARYLKTMFDQDSGRARKSVAVDHLLAGKTRKEASRMFFETLVLKTRDYIHVEQDNPFGCINIKPRIKLLKTEF